MGSNNEVIKTTKEMFNNNFDMKYLGVADVILGIKNLQNIRWTNIISITLH